MEIFDFSNAEYSNRNGSYGGAAGDKDGIVINGEPWIAKYPKSNEGMAKSDDNGASFYPKKSTLAIEQILKLPEADQARNNANVQEPFTIDGEHHLNYCSILDLTESEIPAAQVELLKTAVISNTKLVESKLHEIIEFVKSIPGNYKGYEIISEPRREYYLKSFITRFEDVLKKRRDELCS